MVPNVFLENYAALSITPSEAMLLILLVSFKWTKQAPFPSVQRLAKLMKCSERNIRKLCQSLESVGLIKRIGREGTSNLFDLSGLYAKLEGIISNEGGAEETQAGMSVGAGQ